MSIMTKIEECYPEEFYQSRWRMSWRADLIGRAVLETFLVRSIIDAGCGIGDLVKWFNEHGHNSLGIEGSSACTKHMVTPAFIIHDLRTPLPNKKLFTTDLVTCFEVAEHIDPEYTDIFINNLCLMSKKILMSIAGPGQEGHNHINLQPKEYWIERFKTRRYEYDNSLTQSFSYCLSLYKAGDHRLIQAIRRNAAVFIKEDA